MSLQPGLGCYKRLRKYILLTVCLCIGYTAPAQLNASFVSDKSGGCAPFTIQFTSTTSGASGSAEYLWDFGNGNSSSLSNPAAIYTETKEYTVRLTVKDNGRQSVFTQKITGYKNPVADFSVVANKVCMPAAVQFVSNSTPGDGSIVDYYWDFGDGSTGRGYGNTMSHAYTTLIKPTVNLTVTNNYGCHSTVEKREIAEILPAMQASFTASQQVLCKVTDAVQFTNSSSGPGTLSYTWNFGDGNSSAQKNPSHAFNKKGIYTVSLTVKNGEGCTVTETKSDLLNVASYKASFSGPSTICQGEYANLNLTSSPNPSTTNWYVDNQPATYWYNGLSQYLNDTGKHTIKLVNTFGNNCTDSTSSTIQVHPTPQPSEFIADLQSFCGAPTTVKFKDTTKTAVKWDWRFWDYSNPPTSTLQAPGYTYQSNGSYWVGLTITNAQGCSNSTAKAVTIVKPEVGIYNKLPFDEQYSYCGYLKIQMQAAPYSSSDTVAVYKWIFSDGIISTDAEPVREFTTPGNYSVYLDYTLKSGCKGKSQSYSFTVFKKPKADFTVSSTVICGNTPVTYRYTGGSPGGHITWEFEGLYNGVSFSNESPVIRYLEEGVYGTKITVTNGNCWDTISKRAYVTVKLPFPKISGANKSCEGTRGKVRFTQASVGATSIKWDFGDGKSQSFNSSEPEVEHEYTKTGTYTVVLTATNGQCSVQDVLMVSVLLKQKPKLTLSPTEVCANMPTNFNASAYETNPSSTSWSYDGYYIKRWEYSDGTELVGSYAREYVNYSTPPWINGGKGTITSLQPNNNQIRLITTSYGFGCDDTTTFATIKFKGAKAAFDVVKDKQCYKNGEVILKDASTAPNNTITKWQWNFGDGQTQTFTKGGEVKHTYENPGNYYVTLTITDAGGCSSTTGSYGKQVEVLGPKVGFSMSHGNNVPLNTTVSFYNYTNAYGVNNVEYEWDFGDGSPVSNSASPSHNYPTPGIYTIKLKATDPATGCTSQTEQVLVVRYFNYAFQFSKSFVTSSQCAPAVVNFVNTSYGYTKVVWDFGDNSMPLEDVNYPSHVYKEAGTYEVVLSVYGYNGLTGQYKDTVVVDAPAAALKSAPAEICLGQEAQLKASGPGIAQYTYDPGDGNIRIATDSLLKYSYTTPGTYKPQLLVSNSSGCTKAASNGDIIKVRPQPKLTITPPQPRICLGEDLQLTANATGAVQYTWKPANGISQLNIAGPTVKPNLTTTYQVEAKDDIGCTVNGGTTVMVVQPEYLEVRADTGICYGEQVHMTVSGTTKYLWINNTEGLSSATIASPVAKPQTTTIYTITGGDVYNCFPDTANIEIKVYSLPWVKAPADAEIIAGAPLLLPATASPDVTFWQWSPDKYLDCTYCPAPTTKALANTTYTVTVTNGDGCIAKDDVFIKMQCDAARVRIPNAFSPNGDGHNDVFTILGISYVKKLTIFNRYGRKVFERSNFLAHDRSTGWDGTFNGMQLQTDSYVYFVEMECDEGGVFTRKGTVTLIR